MTSHGTGKQMSSNPHDICNFESVLNYLNSWDETIGVISQQHQRSNPWHLSATESSECSHLNQGSGLVPDYRAYIVGIGGPFNSTRTEFLHNHPDDTTAIEAARRLVHDYDVELWDGDRFVGRLSPEAK
jgi:hypothetical protein